MLDGKVALVTGASRGIGRSIAETFAAKGASVVLVARSDAINEAADACRAHGHPVIAVQGDITTDAIIKDCIKRCRELGGLHVLVNNAGAMPQAVIGMISAADARQLFELNVLSAIQLTQIAARMMKSGASVINMTSIAARGMVGGAVYSASKAAVVGFTHAAAKELAPRGIRVNAVAPGYIETDLVRGTPPAVHERTLGNIAMGKMGQAQDVANAALFLASDLSTYVTGQVIGVDGGMLA